MLVTLPLEVLAMVFEYLPLPDRSATLAVCTAMWDNKYYFPCVLPAATHVWYRPRMNVKPRRVGVTQTSSQLGIACFGGASLMMVRCVVHVMQRNQALAPVDRALGVLHCMSQPCVHSRADGRRWYMSMCRQTWWQHGLPAGVMPVIKGMTHELYHSRPSRSIDDVLRAKLHFYNAGGVDAGQLHLLASLYSAAVKVTSDM